MNASPSEGTLPSLDLLRQLTSRHVFEQLLAQQRLTRAEIAARTGISKPTISESVRRLLETGVITESGRQVGKRGPAGTYLELHPNLAVALAVAIGPGHIIARTLDLRSRQLGELEARITTPIAATRLGPALRRVISDAVAAAPGPVRTCAISVPAPVDVRTSRVIGLPRAPFILGDFSPRDALHGLPVESITVDNDINWAAQAELHDGQALELSNFVLCYLGAGIGGATVIERQVVRGERGLAGELAHILTTGPGGRSMTLLECFAAWKLLQQHTDALDVERIIDILTGTTAAATRRRTGLAQAVAGALVSVIALLNPQAVLIAGPWGAVPGFAEEISERLPSGLTTVVRTADLRDDAPLLGASSSAVQTAREVVTRGL